MALDGTYDGLKLSVADFLNRGDLASAIPDFIALAEEAIATDLVAQGPVRQMMGRSDATISTEFTPVPSDFMGIRGLYFTSTQRTIEWTDPEKIIDLKIMYPSQDGDPQKGAIVGGEFQLWPWVGNSYTAELTYWKRPEALSESNQSNWVITDFPSLYLYGSLLQAAPYLKDDDRVATWGNLYTAAIQRLVGSDKVSRSAPNISPPFLTVTP
jgi:hypothetical protein